MKRVVETLSAGFEVIAKRFWVLLVPIFLDLFLWWGPRISLYPLVQGSLEWMDRFYAQVDVATAANMRQMWEEMNIPELWEEFGREFNLFSILPRLNVVSLLSLGLLDLPSVIATNGPADGTKGVTSAVWEIHNLAGLCALTALLLAAGLLVVTFYQGLIAQQVREQQVNLRYLLRSLGRYCLHVATVALAVSAVAIIVGMPLMLLLILLGAASPLLMQLLAFLVSALAFWVSLYLLFIPQGILLGEEKPLRALWASLNIVQRNFWSVMALLFLSRIIRMGFGLLWPHLVRSMPGTFLAIISNAFISGGLAAASFVFYRDRLAAWREQVQAQAQTQ